MSAIKTEGGFVNIVNTTVSADTESIQIKVYAKMLYADAKVRSDLKSQLIKAGFYAVTDYQSDADTLIQTVDINPFNEN